jgi:hypothetical protein
MHDRRARSTCFREAGSTAFLTSFPLLVRKAGSRKFSSGTYDELRTVPWRAPIIAGVGTSGAPCVTTRGRPFNTVISVITSSSRVATTGSVVSRSTTPPYIKCSSTAVGTCFDQTRLVKIYEPRSFILRLFATRIHMDPLSYARFPWVIDTTESELQTRQSSLFGCFSCSASFRHAKRI